MEGQTNYAKIIAIAKRFAAEAGGGSGGGGVPQEEFDAHIIDNKRHLTNDDRELLIRISQYKGYYSFSSEIPAVGVEGDYILVGETNSFWIYDTVTKKYVDTVDITEYDDTSIKESIKEIKTEIEGIEILTNEDIENLLK